MNGHILLINTAYTPSVLKDVLHRADFSVDSVPDIYDGMKLHSIRNYDVIVLLEKAGSESRIHCEDVRRATDAPLIVINPNATTGACLDAIQTGADFFLRKPFGPLEFVARIKALINRAPVRAPMPADVPVSIS